MGPPLLYALTPLIPSIQPQSDGNGSETSFYYHLLPNNDMIQCNVVADSSYRTHRVEWSWTDDVDPQSLEAEELAKIGRGKASGNGEFVRNLRLGDVVTVWAKSRFPGWANYVLDAKVEVYWTV